MAAKKSSRVPVPVHQQEHGHAGTAKGIHTNVDGLVESIQGSLYGEEEEKWIESFNKTTMTRDAFLSRDELELPWHVRWRIWLLKHSEGVPEQTRKLQEADTRILQRILADLQVDLVFVHENDSGSDDDGASPSRPTLRQEGSEDKAGQDDLMRLVSSGAEDSCSWKKDGMIAAWKSHERYFVLQALTEKNIWLSLTAAQQGLVREILRGIDGLTGSRGMRTPDWMMSEENKSMRRAQQLTPTLVFKSHWRTHEQSRRKPAKRSCRSGRDERFGGM
jgi:hypothetical protein